MASVAGICKQGRAGSREVGRTRTQTRRRNRARLAEPPIHGMEAGIMSKLGILREFWEFMRVRKRYWLMPVAVLLLALGVLLVTAKGSALAPFIYSLF